jgi:hypothetical protein
MRLREAHTKEKKYTITQIEPTATRPRGATRTIVILTQNVSTNQRDAHGKLDNLRPHASV